MKFIKYTHLVYMIFTLWISTSCDKTESWSIVSHDQNLKVEVVIETGKVFYSAFLKEGNEFKMIVQKSPMGIARKDADFTKNLTFSGNSTTREIDEQYEVVTGKKRKLQNRANELSVEFEDPKNNKVQLIFRVFHDGFAFRYLFPENKGGNFEVTEELTGFKFSVGKAWIQPYDDITKWTPAYEAHYMNEVPIGQKSPKKNGWCFPALFQTEDTWILLTEAGIEGDFYGAHLQPDCTDGLYTIRMAEAEEAEGVFDQIAFSNTLPWATPWRTLIIGKNLNTIIQSNIVEHLNPSSKIGDVDWIKPGRVAWSWLSDHDSPQDYSKLKSFVDLAVEMNWEYSLVDANWNTMKGGNIQHLVEYAESKNIGIFLWYNSGGPHNTIDEMVRDKIHNSEKRRIEFAKLQEMGVKGVKIDFFQSDKPGMMKLYKDILEDAFNHSIMVNFHGCTIPRGWSRTYPNLLTMESVRGAECYTFAESYPINAPISNTILPVTRNVVGSMDYTPVLFTDKKMPHITTHGHELALSIVFESGLLHFADHIEAYKSLPDEPKNFLKNVPVAWDGIEYLRGYPGKEMVLARKSGDTWYIGGINGEDTAKSLEIPFLFLEKGLYNAELITDGQHPRSFSSKKFEVEKISRHSIDMLPYGGFIIKLIPK
jgi:alpha-glucosidase